MQRLNPPYLLVLVCLMAVCLLAQPLHTAVAQQTNMSLFEHMAIDCLGPVPASHPEFLFQSPDEGASFIRSTLIQHWQEQEHEVFLPDSIRTNSARSLPILAYSIEKSQVVYERLRKKQVKRDVRLTVHYTLTQADGRIDADEVCSKSESDTIPRDMLPSVETAAFPVTLAPHPPKGWVKRYIEPAILTTATALGVYLFFTLRSDSNDDGS